MSKKKKKGTKLAILPFKILDSAGNTFEVRNYMSEDIEVCIGDADPELPDVSWYLSRGEAKRLRKFLKTWAKVTK